MINERLSKTTSCHYEVIKTIQEHSELGKFTTYGLKAISDNNGLCLETITDISTDYEFVVKTAGLLNKHKLSHIHFLEYISDII